MIFFGSKILNDVSEFILKSDIIVANRMSDELKHVQHKIFTRDIFGEN
jgi:UDPglucose 6-dehydrogenase